MSRTDEYYSRKFIYSMGYTEIKNFIRIGSCLEKVFLHHYEIKRIPGFPNIIIQAPIWQNRDH